MEPLHYDVSTKVLGFKTEKNLEPTEMDEFQKIRAEFQLNGPVKPFELRPNFDQTFYNQSNRYVSSDCFKIDNISINRE